MNNVEKRLVSFVVASAIGVSSIGLIKKGLEDSIGFRYNNAVTYILNNDKTQMLLNDIQFAINNNSIFDEVNYNDKTEGKVFLENITPFINKYGKYLNSKQIKILLDGISNYKGNNDNFDNEHIELYNIMLEMIKDKDNKYIGLNKAFVTSLICGYFNPSALEEDNQYSSFELVTDNISRDKVVKYMLEKDIEGLINELKNYYCLDSEEKINKFIDLLNKGTKEDISNEEDIKISEELKKLYNELIKNKLDKDKYFKDSLLGRISLDNLNKKSGYVGYSYKSEEMSYCISNEKYGYLRLEDTNIKPNNKESTNKIIENYSNSLLYKKINGDEYDRKTLHLLSYIVDISVFSKFNPINSLDILWDNIDYFNTKGELAEFIVALSNGNKKAIEEYLEIVTKRLTTGDITIKNFAELKSLEKFYKDNVYYHVYCYDDEIDTKKLLKDAVVPTGLDVIVEDFIFYDIDPTPYFKKIRDKFLEEGMFIDDTDELGFYKERDYINQNIEYRDSENIVVYGKEVKAKGIYINNKYYVYYRVPKYYENTECVRKRINVHNDMFEEKVNGFITTIYNYNTGLNEQVYLVYMGDKIGLDKFEPVVFKNTYDNILKYSNKLEDKHKLELIYKEPTVE